MTLTRRHVYRDADYGVAVVPTANDGDLQAFVLYDSAGNEISFSGGLAVTANTELPAAVTLADDTANPTVPGVGAFIMGLDPDGTWDRGKLAKAHDLDSGAGTEYGTGVSIRVAASGGSISETYGAGAVAAGTKRITLASDDPAVTSLSSLLTELYVNNGAMAMQVDDAGGGVTYQGWASPGTATSAASWRIRRITEATSDYAIVFADGNRNFDNVWDNRAALSYS